MVSCTHLLELISHSVYILTKFVLFTLHIFIQVILVTYLQDKTNMSCAPSSLPQISSRNNIT